MRKLLMFLQAVILMFVLTSSFQPGSGNRDVTGKVVWEGPDCGYIIIKTQQYYVLATINVRQRIFVGDIVAGELHSHGSVYLRLSSGNNRTFKVYIRNFWVNQASCYDYLRENHLCTGLF